MPSPRILPVIALTIALLASARSARSQNLLDAETTKMYGGAYLADCKDPASPRVSVFQDSLVFTEGDRRVVGTNVEKEYSTFGRMIPPHFRESLIGYLPGNRMFAVYLFVDERGAYLSMGGHPDVEKQIGEAAMALTYGRCDPAGKDVSATSILGPVEISNEPGSELPNSSLFGGDPHFDSAYKKALGQFSSYHWLRDLDGVTTPTKQVTVAGARYFLVNGASEHDTKKNNVTILYSSRTGSLYAKARIGGTPTLLGSPPAAVAQSLDRYWRKAWGQTH